MVDLQTAVSSLMEFAFSGGEGAMQELLKGTVVNSATGLTKVWQDIFDKESSSKDLVVQLQTDNSNKALQLGLKAIITQVLTENPEILEREKASFNLQNIRVDNVKAKDGGIAIGVMTGGEVKAK